MVLILRSEKAYLTLSISRLHRARLVMTVLLQVQDGMALFAERLVVHHGSVSWSNRFFVRNASLMKNGNARGSRFFWADRTHKPPTARVTANQINETTRTTQSRNYKSVEVTESLVYLMERHARGTYFQR